MIQREELIYMAKVCEQAERYEDMLNYIREVALMDQELSTDERNLLSLAYYCCVGSRKTQIRQLNYIENKMTQKVSNNCYCEMDTNQQFSAVVLLKKKVINELNNFCNDYLNVIEYQLLKLQQFTENYFLYQFFKCIYLKHKADYLQDKEERVIAIDKTLQQFEQIYEQVRFSLQPTNQTRLQIVLDFSVFVYDVLKDSRRACEICDDALIQARNQMDKEVNQEEKVKIESILKLIQENRLCY